MSNEQQIWTAENLPRLPRSYNELLIHKWPDYTHWGAWLLTMLVKCLLIRHMEMPSAKSVADYALQFTSERVLQKIVTGLFLDTGTRNVPVGDAAITWFRNFLAFVYEEYGFQGAHAWAQYLFEEQIKTRPSFIEDTGLVEHIPEDCEIVSGSSLYKRPASYPDLGGIFIKVPYPRTLAAVHDTSYQPQHPTLTSEQWDIVYAQRPLAGAMENLGDAVLRHTLAQLVRRTLPTLQPYDIAHLSAIVNSNVLFGNIAQRLHLQYHARSADEASHISKAPTLKPIKLYANLFETMVGVFYCHRPYSEVVAWVDRTFRSLLYAAEQDLLLLPKKNSEKRAAKHERMDGQAISLVLRGRLTPGTSTSTTTGPRLDIPKAAPLESPGRYNLRKRTEKPDASLSQEAEQRPAKKQRVSGAFGATMPLQNVIDLTGPE